MMIMDKNNNNNIDNSNNNSNSNNINSNSNNNSNSYRNNNNINNDNSKNNNNNDNNRKDDKQELKMCKNPLGIAIHIAFRIFNCVKKIFVYLAFVAVKCWHWDDQLVEMHH